MFRLRSSRLSKFCLAVFCSLIFCSSAAYGEEGTLHRLARAVFAIPKAVLNSMEGPHPSCCANGYCNGCSVITYPYYPGVRVIERVPCTTNQCPSICDGCSETLYYHPCACDGITCAPNYVTYHVVIPNNSQLRDTANTHIYNGLSFDNRW